MYTSLFPSLPPKLYINYALFRTRPARLYFRSNRKTTPERKRTMALIYFSHLTTPPLPASRPRWVDASRSIEFTFFPPTPPFFPCYAPSRRAKRRILKNGRELKVFIFSRLGRETLMLPLRVSRVIRAFPHSSCV